MNAANRSTTTRRMHMEGKKKPVMEYPLGNVKGSIWENESEDGKPTYRATVECKYKSGDGDWKEATSYTLQETANLSKVLDMCSRWMMERESERRSRRKNGD